MKTRVSLKYFVNDCRQRSGFIKYVFVLAKFAVAHKSKILIPLALCVPNPRPPRTPLKPSAAWLCRHGH